MHFAIFLNGKLSTLKANNLNEKQDRRKAFFAEILNRVPLQTKTIKADKLDSAMFIRKASGISLNATEKVKDRKCLRLVSLKCRTRFTPSGLDQMGTINHSHFKLTTTRKVLAAIELTPTFIQVVL